MPISSFFTSIGAALTGVFSFLTGGSLLSKIVVFGLSIAARMLLANKQEQPQRQAQASQLETRYGETEPRQIILGTVGTAGHHVYRNAYGPGNTIVQDVYRLADFRIGGVSRVRFDGVWRSLGGAEDGERGFRIQGIDAEVWIKVYLGTMDQAADAGLIARSNPAGRWTEDHRGAGVAYAVVTSVLTRDYLQSPWEAFFEVEGPPLYDWRKDDTAGGDGDDRWSDQASWSGRRDNPILQAYALGRGFFNDDEMIVGKGVDASSLPLAEWTTAANICDEAVDLLSRYSSSCIVASGSDVTHDANLDPILEACAASWVELVGEEYPLVGANQASVATITDDDIVTGERFRLSLKRPRSELVNTVAGSFVNPESFYQSSPLATRIDAAALAADRERLAVSIGYRAVTIPAVADRLADIAIRASRYQANAEICVRPKFLGLRPGQWVTWTSARHGFTKVFQVLSKQLGAYGTNSVRNVYLSLQEVGEGVFDPTEYSTLPPDATGPGEPDFQSELSNFLVSPYTVIDADGKQFPALRAQWDEPDDPTVIGVDIEYWPAFQPAAKVAHPTAPSDVTVALLANGIIASKEFSGHYRLVTSPYRVTPWVEWGPVMTPNAPRNDVLVSLQETAADIRSLAQRLVAFQSQVEDRIEQLAGSTAEGLGASTQEIAAVVRTGRALAASFLLLDAAVNDGETGLQALASAILGVQTSVDDLAAGGLISFEAEVSPPTGIAVQINVLARASTADAFEQAGMVIQLKSDGEGGFTSQIALLADKLVVADPNGNELDYPFVFEDGVLKLNDIWAKIVRAGLFTSDDGNSYFDVREGSTGMRLTF